MIILIDAVLDMLAYIHNLKNVGELCDRVLLLDKGEQIMLGEPEEVIVKYREITKERQEEKDRQKAAGLLKNKLRK